ncbi:MAG: lysylphosphatidylglycerol synthase transmembrane domain-containing protein [Athalassotoga sp.]
MKEGSEVRNESKNERKKLYRSLFIALLSTASVFAVFMIFARDSTQILKILFLSPIDILIGFGLFMGIIFIDTLRTWVMTHFLDEHVNWKVALSNSILGYFYTYITPSSAGGQPFQIYHLSKWKVKPEISSAIILTRWSTMIIFLSISSILLLKRYLFYVQIGIPVISQILWVIILMGITVSFAIVLMLLVPNVGIGLVNFFKKSRILKWIFKLFKKDDVEVLTKFENNVRQFYDAMHMIWMKKPLLIIFDAMTGILDLGILYYILYRSIMAASYENGAQFFLSFWSLSAIFILLSFIVYYFPTPGSSGGIEGAFYLVFSMYGSPPAVMAGILIWRISTYYLPILLGIVTMFFEFKAKSKEVESAEKT